MSGGLGSKGTLGSLRSRLPGRDFPKLQQVKFRDDPVASEVVRTKRQVIFDEVFDDAGVADMARRYNIRSGISTPLKSYGEVNGIRVIATRQERLFSEVDQDFLDSIGGHLEMAIRNVTLYEQS